MDSLDAVHANLKTLAEGIPRLMAGLCAERPEHFESWHTALQTRLLPRFSADFPLLVAVSGGGSSGKSTLFNSLLGGDVSTVGGRAGLNRRVLVAVPAEQRDRDDFLGELFRPFGASPQLLTDKAVLGTPGPPLYAVAPSLPQSVVLMDTPDFDVGRSGEYLNRGLAAPVMTASDVLVYIFTNATYNAKANTEFIREQLTRIGRRRCVLVYRVYESFSRDEVLSHAHTVAENLYGAAFDEQVLAIYRIDDTNEVAAGRQLAIPRWVSGGAPRGGLLDLLAGLDPRELRREQTAGMLADVVSQAGAFREAIHASRIDLSIYRDAIKLAQSRAVADALLEFPLEQIAQHMRKAFETSDSGFVRFSRKVGRVTSAPMRGAMWLMNRAERKSKTAQSLGTRTRTVDRKQATRANFVQAANELRRQVLAAEVNAVTTPTDPDGGKLLSLIAELRERRARTGTQRPFAEPAEGDSVEVAASAHAALEKARQRLQSKPWREELAEVEGAVDDVMKLPDELSDELNVVVLQFREDMPFRKRARAALVSSLNVIPPAVALVYVFATFDPVGGGGLAGKLSGLFGVHDLWATASIPASTGLDKAARTNLEKLLDPVVQRWFASRAQPVWHLFEARITGEVLDAADAILEKTERGLGDVDAALDQLTNRSQTRTKSSSKAR